MAYDPYKCLLASASREHVQRRAALNTHVVGNVFLPALEPPGASATAASLRHLQVIEQCIAAENRREEQLARCGSLKQRQRLTRRFQAQRGRERELISALMLGKPPPDDVPGPQQAQHEAARADRVFRKARATGGVPHAKPHARKQFQLPACNGSPGERSGLRAQAAAAAALSRSPVRAARREGSSSPRERAADALTSPAGPPRGSSKSATSTRSPWLARKPPPTLVMDMAASGPSQATSTPEKRARSPYISPTRLQHKGVRGVRPLAALPTPPVTPNAATSSGAAGGGDDTPERPRGVVAFQGAHSFSEAHLLALGAPVAVAKPLEAARGELFLAETATQTTAREVADQAAQVDKDELLEAPEAKGQQRDERQDADGLLHGVRSQEEAPSPRRPQSSPAVRASAQSVLDTLAALPEDALARLKEAAARDAEAGELEREEEAKEEDAGDDAAVGAASGLQEDASADVQAEESVASSRSSGLGVVRPEDEDEELETDVAEVLFDLVDLVAEAALAMAAVAAAQREAEQEAQQDLALQPRTVSARPRQDTKLQEAAATRIQALYRGHHTRVAFRLALYEDALSCGVLGAMPGTLQGQSGWYQDPKSLMAYFFSIPTPDGDWEQQRVLRCSRLVLTPYHMRREVLSKLQH